MLYCKNDDVALVLFGTEGTDNELASRAAKVDAVMFQRITTAVGFNAGGVTPALLRSVTQYAGTDATGAHGSPADPLEALYVAIGLLGEAKPPPSAARRIVMVTDCSGGSGDLAEAEAFAQQIGAQLAQNSIKLAVFAVGAAAGGLDDPAGPPTARILSSLAMGSLGGCWVPVGTALEALSALRSRSVLPVTLYRGMLDIGGDLARISVWVYKATSEAKPQSLKTAVKAPLLQGGGDTAAALAPWAGAAVAGQAGDGDEAPMQYDGGRQYPAAGPSVFSELIAADVGGSIAGTTTRALPPPPLQPSPPRPAVFERTYRTVPQAPAADAVFDGGGGGDAAAAAPDEGKQVEKSEVLRAFAYGHSLIPVAPPDMQLLAWTTDKSLSVLGTVPATSVPRSLVISDVDVVLPPQGGDKLFDSQSTRALSAFARALAAESCVALARFVPRAASGMSSSPIEFGALIPALATPGNGEPMPAFDPANMHVVFPSPTGVDCLYFVPLPFSDDLRGWQFRDLRARRAGASAAAAPGGADTAAMAARAMDDFITAMDLTNVVRSRGAVLRLPRTNAYGTRCATTLHLDPMLPF